MSEEKLKPCPWGQNKGEHQLSIYRGEEYRTQIETEDDERDGEPTWVECGCGVRGPLDYSKNGAIAAWNIRTPEISATPKELPEEGVKLINETPFLLSLCYDRDLLPEQFLVLKSNPSYHLKYAELMGVLCCYLAMKENPDPVVERMAEALKEIWMELDGRYDGAPDSRVLWMGEHITRIRALLADYERSKQ